MTQEETIDRAMIQNRLSCMKHTLLLVMAMLPDWDQWATWTTAAPACLEKLEDAVRSAVTLCQAAEQGLQQEPLSDEFPPPTPIRQPGE